MSARPDAAIVAAIEHALDGRGARREGREVRFRCPAHDDEHASADWNPRKAVWTCRACGAGGGALDLAQRLGVALPERTPPGLTLVALADAKRLPAEFLRALGVADGTHGRERTPAVVSPYCDAGGELVAERRRVRLHGDSRFRWRPGDHPLPYGLARLADARRAGAPVLIVEGESDCWTLWHAGIAALGVPGASTWRSEWAQHVAGIDALYVWREPDAGGDVLAAKVAASLPDVRVVEAPAGLKDPSALWLDCGADAAAFRERLGALMAAARPASELRAEALSREAREAFDQARGLLDEPDILAHVGGSMRAGGYAGDTTPALLCYVALTSRLLDRPMNLALIAQSASGKSYALDAARALVPQAAYHMEKAGSARALVYGDADFEHKTVIVAEADSIPEDGPAASAVRSIAADNCMTYDVVERDETTGRFTVRHIEKPGPTGLITTSTRALPAQMATRMLTVAITDTRAQTRDVMLATAARVNGRGAPDVDPAALVAAQRWLEAAGERRVMIPFASALAELVPDTLVRMRRDFRQLLTVIQAVALLHQRTRGRDADGRIIATLEDYATARRLMLDTFTAAATGGVSAAVREAVEAVREQGGDAVSVQEVADRLAIDKSSALRRVRRAVTLGYLVNAETRRGLPARLSIGDPLPAEQCLPDAAALSAMCAPAYLPETSATVQPPPFEVAIPDTNQGPGAVARGCATAVQPRATGAQPAAADAQSGCTPNRSATAVQPDVQPPDGPLSDTKTRRDAAPVARLHPDPGEGDTHNTGATADEGCAVCGGMLACFTSDGEPRCARHAPGRCRKCGAECAHTSNLCDECIDGALAALEPAAARRGYVPGREA